VVFGGVADGGGGEEVAVAGVGGGDVCEGVVAGDHTEDVVFFVDLVGSSEIHLVRHSFVGTLAEQESVPEGLAEGVFFFMVYIQMCIMGGGGVRCSVGVGGIRRGRVRGHNVRGDVL
jgi:hypothetical protein